MRAESPIGCAKPRAGEGEDPRRALGRLGEEIALRHLQARGLELVARNQRTRRGEIDLILRDGVALVFVEVKTRCLRLPGARCGRWEAVRDATPLEGLRGRQRARLRRLASAWLREASPRPRPAELRFDAVGVLLDRRGALLRLDHVENAF
jgi:putative endonuclease